MKKSNGRIGATTVTLGMARKKFRVKVASAITETRRDVKNAVARMKGRVWTLQTDLRLRLKKAKKALRKAWSNLWK